MTSVTVHQALYGYADGHRLLASSRSIGGAAGRLLRSVSDMAFDGRSGTYLTVMPLADLKAQAFIRTWPASEIRRPGSVWSHVLLLDFVDLGHLDKAGSLLRLFKPPADDWLSQEDWKSRYGHPLEVSLDANGVPYTTTTELELSLRVLEAVYSSDGPVSVVAGDIDEAERVLIAMFEQQWPRLRRSFAFRTRARSSSTPEGFDVEIVERSKAAAAVPHSIGSWIQVLALDLMRPDPEFRTLLRLFGPESENGRADIPGLVSVLAAVREGNNAAKVLDELCRLFPAPKSMGRLKRTLYGPIEDSAPTLQGWPHEDESRLGLILKSGGVCLDFGDLDVQGRLRRAWTERPANTIHAVAGTATNLKEKHLKSVLSVTAAEAPATYLAKLVDQRGDLGRMMLQHKPSLIRSPELWALESFRPHLLESLHQREKQDQVATLIALIDANEREAAAEVCTVDSSLWWDTFFYSAELVKPRETTRRSI